MSARESMKGEHNEEYIDDSEEFDGHSHKLLKIEYEKCRQKVYDLQRKLRLNETMLREVQEANESLERSVELHVSAKEKVLFETTEKHRLLSEEYENVISTLEGKLAKQATEIEELRKRADNRVESQSISPREKSEYLSLETDNVTLRNRIDQLLSIQREEKQKLERAEARIEELKGQCDEFECYSRGMKEQLDDKDKALEALRAELALNRIEAASLEMEPQRESHKGNSLFAEVDDRRRNIANKMNVLREKYAEIKRLCKSQIAEIKALRAERVATLRKWENDADHTLAENNELIQKYKSRITDLERKLKFEIKKNFDLERQPHTNTSFEYFQSLLDGKRRETAELRIKVEDLCTKLLVQEEAKTNIGKQLQYWRYKASTLEAQMCAAQAELKLDIVNDGECDVLSEPDKFEGTRNCSVTLKDKRSLSASYCPMIQDIDHKLQDCRDRDPSASNEIFDPCCAVESNKVCTPEKSWEIEFGQIKECSDVKRANKVLRFKGNSVTQKSQTSQESSENCKYPVFYIPTDSSG